MTAALTDFSATAARWLAAAAFDGTMFAALCWLTSITLLRRAGGRFLALLWLAALLRFVVWGPLEFHAVPLGMALDAAPRHASSAGVLWLMLGYAAALSAIILRVLARQRRVQRNVAALHPAPLSIIACVRHAAQQLSLRRTPGVRVTHTSIPPFSVGTLHPILVLPQWLCEPGPRLHAVLLHELAHLERRDHFSIWIERAIACLFFVWPPVHWIARKLHDARELACDERAIERGGFSAPEYASHLLEVVARTRGRVTRDTLAIGHTAARLERRIDWLLDDNRPQRPIFTHAAVLIMLLTVALVELRPQPAATASLAASRRSVPSADASHLSNIDEGGCDEPSVALQCGP
jgi:beta-lactamase regulating signal transducer with metallopeptidase domain